jgi:hypothetical protein
MIGSDNIMKITPNLSLILLSLVLFATACTAQTPTPTTPAPTEAPALPATAEPTATVSLPSPTVEVAPTTEQEPSDEIEEYQMNIQIGDQTPTATLVDNSSTQALIAALVEGPLSIEMSDYGSMEKVGPFGFDLPRNDEQITTEAGDLILYQGNAFVIYYAPNNWNFTRLGKIDDVTAEQLKAILGEGDVTVTLSLPTY